MILDEYITNISQQVLAVLENLVFSALYVYLEKVYLFMQIISQAN